MYPPCLVLFPFINFIKAIKMFSWKRLILFLVPIIHSCRIVARTKEREENAKIARKLELKKIKMGQNLFF